MDALLQVSTAAEVHAELSLFPPSNCFHADIHSAKLKLNTLTSITLIAKTNHKVLEPQGSMLLKNARD